MSRERLVRLALLSYPRSVRDERGEEMLATAVESSARSRARAAVELAALARAGLQARARPAGDPHSARLLADALCLAAVIWMAGLLLVWLTDLLEGYGDLAGPLLLLCVAVAAALVGWDRLAGVLGLVWVASADPWNWFGLRDHEGGTLVTSWIAGVIVQDAVLLVGLAAMLIAPRVRPLDPRRLGWLVVLGAAAALDAVDASAPDVPLAVVVVAAIVSVAFAGRIALSVALLWTGHFALEPLVTGVFYGYADSPLWPAPLMLVAVLALLVRPALRRKRAAPHS